jgi:TRAP-type uncharacterized transport system fused permease subunit
MLDWSDFGVRSIAAIFAFLVATAMLAGAVYGGLHVRLSARERVLFAVAGPCLLFGFLLTQNWLIGAAGPAVLGLWFLFRARTRKVAGSLSDTDSARQAPSMPD